MRFSIGGVHDIQPSMSLFVDFLSQKLSYGNILISYGGGGMEEGDGLPFLLTKMTGSLSYQYLEEEYGTLLLVGYIKQDSFIRDLEAKPF